MSRWPGKILYLALIALIAFPAIVSAVEPRADIAYVVVNSFGIDSSLLELFDSLEYSYEIVYESDIPTTDLSEFRLVIIGDQNLKNPRDFPINENKVIVLNSYNYYESTQLGLSGSRSFVSSPSTLKVRLTSSDIAQDVPEQFYAYSISNPNVNSYVLKGQKPTGTKIIISSASLSADAVIAALEPGTNLLNGKQLEERVLFFGIPKVQYWTPQTKTVFENGFNWVMVGEDFDNDGFESDLDCDDREEQIYPGADEIPYDGIDQNCDGSDLEDVDEDGFKSEIVGGLDCDDHDSLINPSNPSPFDNCLNDAPIISDLEEIVVSEGELVYFEIEAIDAEDDELFFSVGDVRFDIEGNAFSWQTDFDDAGLYEFVVEVSDGELSSEVSVFVRVENVNRAPEFEEMPGVVWNEDENTTLNLSEYISDPDGDSIYFEIKDTSWDTSIIVERVSNGVYVFRTEENFFGNDWIVFSATDAKGGPASLSNAIQLEVLPVNDAPVLVREIENLSVEEDGFYEGVLDLSEYFADVDSDLIFSVSGNDVIEVIVEGSIVSVGSPENFVGSEEVYFKAVDEEFDIEFGPVKIEVTNVNDGPLFGEQDCLVEILEDSVNECALNVSDPEDDSLEFSVLRQENIECGFEGNVLTYSPALDFNGEAVCDVSVSDGFGGVDEMSFVFEVLPVNDAPVLVREIENLSVEEDGFYEGVLDLSEYFADVDSDLIFSVSGNDVIEVIVEGSIVSVGSPENFVGSEEVYFKAVDEEFDIEFGPVKIEVTNVNDGPLFGEQDCLVEILEDSVNECALNVSDPEDDSLEFSVLRQENIECGFEGNVLTYSPALDFNGEAVCDVSVSDGFGGVDEMSFVFEVLPVNDAPQILGFDPLEEIIKIGIGQEKVFSVEFSDIESEPDVIWKVNGELQGSSRDSTEFVFSGEAGVYIVDALVDDGENLSARQWIVIIDSTAISLCSDLGGEICGEGSYCENPVDSADGECCLSACVVDDASICEVADNETSVSIRSPTSGDEYDIGERIPVRVDVSNKAERDKKFDVKVSLMDKETDRVVESEKTEIKIEGDERSIVRLNLIVPEDLEKDGNRFSLKVEVNDQECSSEAVDIRIKRPSNKLSISRFDLPARAQCGEIIQIRTRISNIGSKAQDVEMILENSEIGLRKQESFSLERFDEEDTETFSYSFKIPGDIDKKLNVRVSASSEDAATVRETKEIEVSCFNEEEPVVSAGASSEVPQKIELVSGNVREDSPPESESNVIWLLLIFELVALGVGASLYLYVTSGRKPKIR